MFTNTRSQIDSVPIISKIFFWWLFPLLRLGNSRELELDDLYKVTEETKAENIGKRILKHWEYETNLSTKRRSLFKVLLQTFGMEFLRLIIAMSFIELVKSSQFLVFAFWLGYFSDEISFETGWTLAVVICVIDFAYNIFRPYLWFRCQCLCMRIRVGITRIIHLKILRLSQKSLSSSSGAEIINILSNDLNRFDRYAYAFPSFLSGPLQMIFLAVILWTYMGPSSLAADILLLSIIPIQAYVAVVIGKLRGIIGHKSEKRVKHISELVLGIVLIKTNAWEEKFRDIVTDARMDEVTMINKKSILFALNLSFLRIMIKLVVFVPLVVYVLLGYHLTPVTAFVTIAICTNVMESIGFLVPYALSGLSEIVVSTKRIQKILEMDEHRIPIMQSRDEVGIQLQHITSRWSNDVPVISDVSFTLNASSLLTLTGPVGSGKSSLLDVILLELPVETGEIRIKGKIAYASQEPWLFNGTILENIILGFPLDEKKFEKIINACELRKDILTLPRGLHTLVGERGLGVSGGQKARINLARCLYADGDIYLLDDPFSAVDTRVGRHLLDECIMGILKNKCVILTTHHTHHLSPASQVLLLKKGKIEKVGNYEEMKKSLPEVGNGLDALCEMEKEITNSDATRAQYRITQYGTFSDKIAPANLVIVKKEFVSVGLVGWRIYYNHLVSGNGMIGILFIFILSSVYQILYTGIDYWLRLWLLQVSSIPDKVGSTLSNDNKYYLAVYAGSILLFIPVTILRSTFIYKILLNASVHLHDEALWAILRAPIKFFEFNTSWRVLNRFANDVGNVDELVPFHYHTVIVNIATISGVLVIATIIQPVLLIPAAIMVFLGTFTWIFYAKVASNAKRLESSAKSAVFGDMSTTVSGLPTIRAQGAQAYFDNKFLKSQNLHTASFILTIAATNWCSSVIGCIASFFSAVVIFAFMISPEESATVGLVLSNIFLLNFTFINYFYRLAELNNVLVSVERLVEYTRIPSEIELKIPRRRPHFSWPQRGEIRLKNLTIGYGNNEPVLKGVSVMVGGGEKVGVVGRTGAGKTTLISSLFRLVEPRSGEIHIDGINTLQIGLHDLRTKISYISQNPILFKGTVKSNLDPLECYTEQELWEALQKVRLTYRILSSEGLYTEVAELGTNFSLGEKQLLCLARSLLNKNRILVLDEATSNIHPATDNLIQETLRVHFVDCTVVVVAHRLDTVMDMDRICVVEDGKVVEFDEPFTLLSQGYGRLFELVQKTGVDSAKNLTRIAQEAKERKLSTKVSIRNHRMN